MSTWYPGVGGDQTQVNQPDAREQQAQISHQSNVDKYRTGIAEMATDEYGRTRNIYQDNKPLLTFDDGKVVRQGGFKRDDQGQYYVPPGEISGVGDKGALLSDLERMQLAALKMGHKTSLGDPVSEGAQWQSGLGSLVSLDSEGNPLYDAQGELRLTGLGRSVGDNWNKLVTAYDDAGTDYGGGQGRMLQDIIEDYRGGFDQRFYGMDPFDYSYYGGRPETTELIAGGPWSQKGLGEVLAQGPKGFGEMESMYGEELDPGRDASWLYLSEFGPQFRDQYIYS